MAVTQVDILYPSTIDGYQLAAKVCYPTGGTNLPVVAIMHGFGQDVADFDQAAYNRFAEGTYFDLVSVTGTFQNNETVTGGTSGATATINRVVNSSTMKRITCASVVGTFVDGESITGATSGATATIDVLYQTSCFAVFVEMRGRGLSEGAHDVSGREIYDIVDAVNYCFSAYNAQTDSSQAHIVGYSGGGGNVFAAITKFPDFWNSAASFFGISDYGYDPTNGWFWTAPNDGYREQLTAWIPGTPLDAINRYHARASVLAIANYSGGYIRMHHDLNDTITPVVLSRNVRDAFDDASLSNYDYLETDGSSNPKWLHALPTTGQQIVLAEPDFMADISAKSHSAWTVATSGTLKIPGYVVTKRFAVFLGSGGTGDFGEVVYNTSTRVFTITFDTSGTRWHLYLYGQSFGATVSVTVNSVSYDAVIDADGVGHYTNTPPPVKAAFRLINRLRPGVR